MQLNHEWTRTDTNKKPRAGIVLHCVAFFAQLAGNMNAGWRRLA